MHYTVNQALKKKTGTEIFKLASSLDTSCCISIFAVIQFILIKIKFHQSPFLVNIRLTNTNDLQILKIYMCPNLNNKKMRIDQEFCLHYRYYSHCIDIRSNTLQLKIFILIFSIFKNAISF